jgi:hypothetical protein
MGLPLTRLEILLATALVCALIGFCYEAFIVPDQCPGILKSTVEACNANMEAKMVNLCQQSYYSPSSFDIRDNYSSPLLNQTLNSRNLSIETNWERLNKRLNPK